MKLREGRDERRCYYLKYRSSNNYLQLLDVKITLRLSTSIDSPYAILWRMKVICIFSSTHVGDWTGIQMVNQENILNDV